MSSTLLVRPAAPADYRHFVRLFPELHVDDPIASADRWERVLMPETWIFEEAGAVIAYVFVQILRGVGYVRQLVVDPSGRGRGVGRAVMEAVAARLREAGCSSWCLNVKPENTPAVRLYERVGMRPGYLMTALRFPWDIVERLPRGDRVVLARPVDAASSGPIESTFGLVDGQVTSALAKTGLVLRVLVDSSDPSGAPLGYASFDPEFPGAYPFRVAHPTLAAPLLEALRPHARPEPPYMQSVIEDDDALARAFVDAGASVRLSGVHMKGPL